MSRACEFASAVEGSRAGTMRIIEVCYSRLGAVQAS